MKAANILCGIIMIIAGIVCLVHPFEAQLAYGYMTAIVIGCLGIILIINYFKYRKEMKAAGLEATTGVVGLVAGILGLIFMIMNIEIPGFVYSVQHFAVLILMAMLILEGIAAIVVGVKSQGSARILGILFGIVMIITCLMGAACPAIVISVMGAWLGIGFALYGINRILIAFQ